MTEPTLDTLAHRLGRMEQKFRWLTAVFLVLIVILASGMLVIPRFLVGRYQVVGLEGTLHRLDTRSGELQMFVLAPETAALTRLGSRFKYVPGPSSEQ